MIQQPGSRASQLAPHDVTGKKPSVWPRYDAISGTPTRTIVAFRGCADAARLVWSLCFEDINWGRTPTFGFARRVWVSGRVLQQLSREGGAGETGMAAGRPRPRSRLVGTHRPSSHSWPSSVGGDCPKGRAGARAESSERAPAGASQLGPSRRASCYRCLLTGRPWARVAHAAGNSVRLRFEVAIPSA